MKKLSILKICLFLLAICFVGQIELQAKAAQSPVLAQETEQVGAYTGWDRTCLLYTSPSPRD